MSMGCDVKSGVRGVALISVLLVVSIVSSMAVQLLYRQNIDIERSTRIMSREQAFLYVFGLETYARDLLARDNPAYDYYYPYQSYEEGDAKLEEWSWPIPHRYMSDEWLEAFRRIDARVEARVYDLSGSFNINGVRQAIFRRRNTNPPGVFTWEWMYEKTFKGLLGGRSQTGGASRVDELWNTVVDWFDKDDKVGTGGAEDREYLDREPPYITGQVRMAWPDEIRLLKGFNGAVADRLLPVLTSLPREGLVTMNINTIDSGLLRHIPGLDQPGVVSEIRQRFVDQGYFHTRAGIKSFFGYLERQLALEENSLRPAAKFFHVRSDFFLFSACVRFGRSRPIEIQSVLHRRPRNEKNKVVVLQRRIGSGYYKGGRCDRVAPLSATGT